MGERAFGAALFVAMRRLKQQRACIAFNSCEKGSGFGAQTKIACFVSIYCFGVLPHLWAMFRTTTKFWPSIRSTRASFPSPPSSLLAAYSV